MADERELSEREEFFARLDDVVDEMYRLFTEHEAYVAEYSRMMEYMNTRDGWRAAYVQRVAGDDSVEGNDD